MAHVEVHQAVRDHRKVFDLAVRLDLLEPCVVGHLAFLWLWSVDNAPDGQLPASVRLIERAWGWTGDSGRLVDGLIACRFVDRLDDGSLWVHDWLDYVGRLMEQRRSNARRQQAWRDRNRAAASPDVTENRDVTGTSALRTGALYRTVPDRTVPDRTVLC